MNLFQKAIGYLARSIGLTDPRLVQAAGGRTTTTGEVVSSASVLGLASAWACVNLLAGTIASLPLMVYRTKGGARTVATDHPLYRILHDSPNADQTAVDFWEFICASIELSGNAYAEIIRGSNGRVVALSVPIAPELMTVRRLRDGSLGRVAGGAARLENVAGARIVALIGKADGIHRGQPIRDRLARQNRRIELDGVEARRQREAELVRDQGPSGPELAFETPHAKLPRQTEAAPVGEAREHDDDQARAVEPGREGAEHGAAWDGDAEPTPRRDGRRAIGLGAAQREDQVVPGRQGGIGGGVQPAIGDLAGAIKQRHEGPP